MNELVAYKDFYKEIIDTINARRYKAYKSLNRHHIEHHFELGEIIVKHQEKQKWGQSIVEKLSTDITKQIDGLSGYSPQNLWKMRQFYLEYREKTVLYELAKQIPWGQNMLVLHQVKDDNERRYYLEATAKLGWSRAVLLKSN